ncbi:HtaA domain-containing protein [Streptomyces sp. NPDC094437]|uniref:HtaA domain-containing protein n=1 Tax=Streptomyces sp. NPDC094437 TaxID=3366060 RepID=UPI00382FFC74
MPARLRALVTVLCAAVLGALLPVSTAHATSRTVQGGRLDWGIKSSFQSYVTGPIAKGSYSLTGGAATVGSAGFRFHSASGSYDGAAGSFRAGFSGGVHFLGHRTDAGVYQLDLTISRPTVSISGSTGTLSVDIVSKAKDTGKVTTSSQVPFATLSLGSIDMHGDGNEVVLTNLPATLTSQGAASFAGYYTAGTALDPVSLTADVRAAASTPTPTSTPKASTSPEKKPEKRETSGDEVKDGAVDWGVRRTFREYVTGDIAQGEWTLSDGAQDGGALFRFPKGEGTYEKGELKAAFAGAVAFTGAHGLDLRFSGVRVAVEDGKGTLSADVTGADFTGKKVALVTFEAKSLKSADGLAQLTEAPATLTAEGAKAFGAMYQPGTAMDPVSLAVALTDDAKLPPLPDLGATPTPTNSPSPSATSTTEASPEPVAGTSSEDAFPTLPVSLAAGALLLAGAAYLAIRARRTRVAVEATPDGGSPDKGTAPEPPQA